MAAYKYGSSPTYTSNIQKIKPSSSKSTRKVVIVMEKLAVQVLICSLLAALLLLSSPARSQEVGKYFLSCFVLFFFFFFKSKSLVQNSLDLVQVRSIHYGSLNSFSQFFFNLQDLNSKSCFYICILQTWFFGIFVSS